MSLDPGYLARMAERGPFTRVVVARVQGSTPREEGAAMLVWPDRCEGTIGGGALEFAAIAKARAGMEGLETVPLGPAMGQCCGGAVTLAYERFDTQRIARIEGAWHARPVGGAGAAPLAVTRALARARDRGAAPPLLTGAWLIERVAPPATPVWIWGAGHVGRALVGTLHPLPDLAISWTDSGAERFPEAIPQGVTPLIAQDPARLVPLAPATARHFVLTYSHALDLELCHRLLGHGFGTLGLIGSASKWARFRKRLRALGHSDAQISRIACPIGDPSLGKHPQAIALGVAAALVRDLNEAGAAETMGMRAG
ncbi:xanthine dehydrogenase accessory protein XdhC [Thioclava atlantica]|uniref:Xanthine dehydrogenase accessory protein XdhC n=1 Tax=Thioclava atlantica TaxID=1317124 RepID=A0A085TSH6_9RHOB|nr:xanthine dehydrogenase accessory protein XdhC [Thioclava atlantica]KFE33673.1 xanthine dehydrogenase accessory protein XdhC [Thioclava atlantica]